MDVLHIVFLRIYIIDAYAVWYFFNQNYVILKSSFLEISGENQKFLKKALFYFLRLFHNWKPDAFSYTLCYPA